MATPSETPDPASDEDPPEEPKYYGMTKRAHIITAIIFGTVTLCCFGAAQGWFGESEPEPPPLSEQAQNICYDEVLNQLKAPSTAELVSIAASPTEGDTWTVTGSVDAENSFGAMLRNDFECNVTNTGDRWTIDSIYVS
jgi:hypothetical protein